MAELEFVDLSDPKLQTKHPKCLGHKYWTDIGWEYDCGYGTTLDCDQCKYGGGRCDPEAKCNQLD